MKILITGGCGFLGSAVAKFLIKMKHEVLVIDKIKNNKFRTFKSTILNKKKLDNKFRNIDTVFHFAGLSDLDDASNKPYEAAKHNILGTINILDLCLKHKVKKFIFASSIYASSSEGGFYKSSKLAAEDFIIEYNKKFNLNFVILRFGSIFGSTASKNNGIKKIITSSIKKNCIIYSGSKSAKRKYIHVDEAAIQCIQTLKKKYNKCIVNIEGNKKTKISSVLNIISKLTKIKKIKYLNLKNTGHYNEYPTLPKPLKQKKINIKIKKNIINCLPFLIQELKKAVKI